MHLLYNISIYCYELILWISAIFNTKAKLWIEGRQGIFRSLKVQLIDVENIVWIHCSSLGEFEQGEPIIKQYKTKYPNHKIILTFFSPSGFETKKNYTYVDWVYYLPSDTPSNSKKFIEIVNPIKVIFIKYDFWFNYISAANKKNIPIYIVSAIFRKNQPIIKYSWTIKQLHKVTHFFVQNEKSKELLNNIEINNVIVTGDTRFDQVKTTSKNPKDIPLISAFTKANNTIIFGSTWQEDENIILEYITNNPQHKYIIAPHEINHLDSLLKGANGILYSEATEENIRNVNVLIINNIGLLSNIYQYGKLAYIGGGFGNGIHNTLEPVAFGIPVIFGPNYHKSQEAKKMIELGIGKSIKSTNEIEDSISYWLQNDMRSQCLDFISKNIGATKKILKKI